MERNANPCARSPTKGAQKSNLAVPGLTLFHRKSLQMYASIPRSQPGLWVRGLFPDLRKLQPERAENRLALIFRFGHDQDFSCIPLLSPTSNHLTERRCRIVVRRASRSRPMVTNAKHRPGRTLQLPDPTLHHRCVGGRRRHIKEDASPVES